MFNWKWLQVEWCAYSPDGAFIASASCDRTLRLWDATSGEQLQVLEEHTDYVKSPHGFVCLQYNLERGELCGSYRRIVVHSHLEGIGSCLPRGTRP